MKHVPSTPSRRRAAYALSAAAAALCLFGLTLYARAPYASTAEGAGPGSAGAPARQSNVQAPTRPSRARNLALRPEAQNFARRVGLRFVEAGREASILIGTLSVGGEHKRVRVLRLQGDGGERVEVTLEGVRETLSWDADSGSISPGAQSGQMATLLERLVMDSPDQFALAQLRGASYYTVARNVRPTDDGGADGYTGPLHDVVRVGEPARGDGRGWASAWRLYHVNTATGLIEKVVSEEDGTTVEAALSEWGTRAGETLPARVTWARGGLVFMELTLTNVAHGPKQ